MSASGVGQQGNEEDEQEAQEEVFEGDPPPAIQEVSGGHHGKTFLGGQYGQYIGTQVNKSYNPVGAFTKPQKAGQFQVSCLITVYEKDPISLSSRIFKGCLHSDVTGDRDAAVKITAAQKQNYREAKIFFSVPHHKNIVERFATDTFSFRGQPSIFIAMERCDCNLYDHVKSEVGNNVEFDAEKYTGIAYQILVGLDFLHSHNVVHGDFKPANVLLILNGNIVKLSDFGLSRAIAHGNASTQLTSPQGGTTGWQAPEILEGTMRISIASDIFPCGLTLHFVWSHGKHAYGDRSVSLNHYIVEGINLDLSQMLVPFKDDAKVLLEKTFRRNPADRPTTGELLQNPIFSRFGTRPTGVDDAQVTEVFNQALRFMNPQGAQASNVNEDDFTPLGATVGQLQTAMRSFLERNQLQVTATSSGSSETSSGPRSLAPPVKKPRSALMSLQPSPLPRSVNAPASRAFEGPSGATDSKRLFVGSPETTGDNPVTVSHQSRNICGGESDSGTQRYDFILMSLIPTDVQHLLPMVSKIFETAPRKAKFMHCKNQTNSFDQIEECLLNVKTRDDGISTVVVAYGIAAGLLRMSEHWGAGIEDSIQGRHSLAVFVFSTYNSYINKSRAVIRLIEGTGAMSEKISELKEIIIRQERWCGFTGPFLEDFANNTQVIDYLKKMVGADGSTIFNAVVDEKLSAFMEVKCHNISSPLCRNGCVVILMSRKPSDKQNLPRIISQLYGTESYNGQGEFICCGYDSIPEMILERLSNMTACDEGITTIIVAYSDATLPLVQALEENNLRRTLRTTGLSGENLKRELQKMKRSLAVFTLDPSKYISQDLAKIAVNINLRKYESDGKLQSASLENGGLVNIITFQGSGFSDVGEIINNQNIMLFIRMILRRFCNPEYCNQH